MPNYSSITIIYNPNSTGPGKAMAQELTATLKERLPKQQITLTATKRAGHAEELAYDLAKRDKRPLIISVSGDGGYHEVVNGAARAKGEGANPITGLLPAGNANDHFHSLHNEDSVEAIVAGRHQTIDLLKITATQGDDIITRYAHSYIGFGLTPRVGKQLTEAKLNKFNELWIVAKSLLSHKHCKLEINNKTQSFDSLIFSNINRMAKVLQLSKESEANDGNFEVTAQKHRGRLKMIIYLLVASTRGINTSVQTNRYDFRTVHPTLMQSDGEVISLPAGAKMVVTSAENILDCIV